MKNPNTTKAYDYLRKRILSGEFAPGVFLSAQRLSVEIGVSRTPVREALRKLEYDELVTIVPKLGAVVKTMSADEFQELLGYREALEVFAVGRAALLRRKEEIAHLKVTLELMYELTQELEANSENEDALLNLADQDIRYHRMIFGVARNEFIREKSERAHILQRMVTPPLVAEWVTRETSADPINIKAVFREHSEIFEAIRDGDVSRAQSAMALHLDNFAKKMSRRGGFGSDDLILRNARAVMI